MIFGEHIISAESLARRISQRLGHELVTSGVPFIGKDKPWTAAVRRIMTELGRELGVDCHHEQSAKGTEKLFDLIWMRDGRMKMALESEWNRRPAEIAYDFEKLFYAKAPLKVCIHTRQRQESELLRGLELLLQGHRSHVESEEYVVIRLSDSGRDRNVYAYSFSVPAVKDGCVPAELVRLLPVPNSPFSWTLP